MTTLLRKSPGYDRVCIYDITIIVKINAHDSFNWLGQLLLALVVVNLSYKTKLVVQL